MNLRNSATFENNVLLGTAGAAEYTYVDAVKYVFANRRAATGTFATISRDHQRVADAAEERAEERSAPKERGAVPGG